MEAFTKMKREELGVGYVARLFNVTKDTIKKWSAEFAEFLSSSANPRKGHARKYNQSDLRVLALISEYKDWEGEEDDHDYSGIYFALNSGEHNDDRYVEFAHLNSPIFQEVPEDIDETWTHGVIIGGIASPKILAVARHYKTAGDVLVKLALELENVERNELALPILFSYRHALELYLKIMSKNKGLIHSIESLVNSLRERYKPRKLNDFLKNLLYDFSEIDDGSNVFRYADRLPLDERWVDLHHLQNVMTILCREFEELLAKE
jgi:hypothetical protein